MAQILNVDTSRWSAGALYRRGDGRSRFYCVRIRDRRTDKVWRLSTKADAQLAMLDYFGGITTTRVIRRECDVLITHDQWGDDTSIGSPWELVWEGGRPGDRDERYRLYTRPDGQ